MSLFTFSAVLVPDPTHWAAANVFVTCEYDVSFLHPCRSSDFALCGTKQGRSLMFLSKTCWHQVCKDNILIGAEAR